MNACRQLGFSSGSSVSYSRYGDVPYDFSMDDVDCDGSESIIQECGYNLSENCINTEGAGVQCIGNSNLYI